jgi:hypothetical protein
MRLTHAHAAFGAVFGFVVARYLEAPYWGYVLAMPGFGALAYGLSLWRLRRLGMKPDTLYLDYVAEMKRRWREGG